MQTFRLQVELLDKMQAVCSIWGMLMPKSYSSSIWNSNLTGRPILLLAKSGNPTFWGTIWKSFYLLMLLANHLGKGFINRHTLSNVSGSVFSSGFKKINRLYTTLFLWSSCWEGKLSREQGSGKALISSAWDPGVVWEHAEGPSSQSSAAARRDPPTGEARGHRRLVPVEEQGRRTSKQWHWLDFTERGLQARVILL